MIKFAKYSKKILDKSKIFSLNRNAGAYDRCLQQYQKIERNNVKISNIFGSCAQKCSRRVHSQSCR